MTQSKRLSLAAIFGVLATVLPHSRHTEVTPNRAPKPAALRDAYRDKEVREHNDKIDLHQRQAIRRRIRKATKRQAIRRRIREATKQQVVREGFREQATGRKQFRGWVQHRTAQVFALVKPPRPEEVQAASIAGLVG